MQRIITLLFLLFSLCISAQEIDTITIENKGTLKIELDSKINKIITAKENENCVTITPKNTKKETKTNSSDPCANQNQINGFKIQIYYSKNRAEANKVKAEFENTYPNLSAQVVYYAPDYRVLVGDYFTKKSANPDIKRLKSKYNSAFSIPYKVLCRKAK